MTFSFRDNDPIITSSSNNKNIIIMNNANMKGSVYDKLKNHYKKEYYFIHGADELTPD